VPTTVQKAERMEADSERLDTTRLTPTAAVARCRVTFIGPNYKDKSHRITTS